MINKGKYKLTKRAAKNRILSIECRRLFRKYSEIARLNSITGNYDIS